MLHDSIDATLFPSLPPDVLEEAKQEGLARTFQPGEPLFAEGMLDYDFFVLLSGEVRISQRVGDEEQILGVYRRGEFVGELSLLSGGPARVTGRAVGTVRTLQVKADTFRKMMAQCSPLAKFAVQGMVARRQEVEAQVRQHEKLAMLGRMAAGLAHELNNPAAAARRSAEQLREKSLAAQHQALAYDSRLTDPQREALLELVSELQASPPKPLDALSQSDLEDALLEWLGIHGMSQAYGRAATFAAAGVDLPHLEVLGASLEGPVLAAGLEWLETLLALAQLADVLEAGTARISSLVSAVSQYTYVDREVPQEVDVHTGLEATLAMFAHRLHGGVTVTRDYDTSLPKLWAHGGELNQVWSNLIENALDAMQDRGILRVSTRRRGDEVYVEIGDNGPGISKDILARIWEPFFTTKAMGQGTGLGLDIVLRIIERHHGGRILVESVPGNTFFRVELPLKPELPH
ncbi:ATP-binding protein [Stigmatella sp. ncwal1]|uniref:histidine kinase n=1 Tax=Stigmatella ashevillensis TaxID=2995309 RepID=A0ABT5DJ24_9BACT|nr:ATP-binding protein [Stigmatella ashevillena]MDC0713079.1 ATP-binding protein [Stigmatella ashevillena]